MIRGVRRPTVWCPFRSTCASRAVAALIAIAVLAPASAGAQTPSETPRFNITPTTLVLRPTETSTSLLLKNESIQPIRFQVSAFTWTNDSDGQMQLDPTKDVVFFPTLFSI